MENKENSKIRIKLGGLEVEFEGSETFLENHLPNLLELLTSLSAYDFEEDDLSEEGELLDELPDSQGKKTLDLTTSTIANKLDSKSGRDLVLSACAHLQLAKGHTQYKRSNILAEMQTASSYYKKSYRSNLTMTLRRMVKAGELNELANDTYALEAKKAKEIEKSLSGN